MPFALAFAVQGCEKKEDEAPPQPTAAPTPTPAPSAAPPVQLQTEEDAGSDAADDADASDAAPKATGGGDPTGVRKCCAALRQNANSAPLDQKGSYLSAAAMCDGLVNSPQGRQALSAIRGVLRGANMPSACQ
ncbi:MAG: acyltransferase [Polyangiaceae bacterium]|nr:acyltransferase [Polyangiaceae bacterium]